MPPELGLSYAFFDVDDTIISLKSILSFQDFWFAYKQDDEGRAQFARMIATVAREHESWEIVHRNLALSFATRWAAEVETVAGLWFTHVEAAVPSLYHAPVVAQLRHHQRQGVPPVFVSGSFPPLIAPIARRLEVSHCLATNLEIVEGRYTGRVLPPQTIGQGKADAMRDFMAVYGVDPQECYAYADDISDVPMLQMVGHPVAVLGGRGLEAYARTAGWACLDPNV